MLQYALRRFALAVLIVLVAVTAMFLMIRAVPGDPVQIMLGPRATPELQARLTAELALDQPIWRQLVIFYGNLLQGDLGTDVFSGRSVTNIVFQQLPHTLSLIFASILWSAALGIGLGAYAAAHPNTLIDRMTAAISVAFVAAPAFVVALLSLLIFAVNLKWFPAIGVGEGIWDKLDHLVLPAFAIGLSWVGYVARLVRASMLEVMGENHIRTARAFGISEGRIVLSYALRIAILPVVTVIGVGMGFLLSSAVFAEIVFARPGLGKLVIDSITTRNYPIVMGSVLVSTTLFVVSTALADLINAWLDPRARSEN
ncbi:dipeptide ABC trasnporter, permease protein [Roseobacter sp. SK209-2-6]|uniref:ABC transporter permease n=1 Tax=Roseobacter sp. SK209-2-6 TaxID=388739 RepID=UPI0000F3F5CF|nr:ABC transporter permease [Roseobacter sp. SK209-2-6]EBA17853.1 dipeptide ABC trasnporter, permease protein [Roseobacter sp. SK209-2-6]